MHMKRSSLKLFPFAIPTDQKCFPQTYPGWKMTKFFPYFSRLSRNPGSVAHIAACAEGLAAIFCNECYIIGKSFYPNQH